MKQNTQKIVILGLFICLGVIMYLLNDNTKDKTSISQQKELSSYKSPALNLEKTNKKLELLKEELKKTETLLKQNSLNKSIEKDNTTKELEKLRQQIEQSKKNLKSLSK